MGVPFAVGAFFVSAFAAASSHNQQKKAARAQKEQGEISLAQQKAADLEARRNKLRQERELRAKAIVAGHRTGTVGSSSEVSGIGNLSTNIASSLAFQTGQQVAATAISNQGQQVANAIYKANTWNQIGNLSSQAFSTAMSDEATRKEFFDMFKE